MALIDPAAFPTQRPRLASPLLKTIPFIKPSRSLRDLANRQMYLLNSSPRPSLSNRRTQQHGANALSSTSRSYVHSPNQHLVPLFPTGVSAYSRGAPCWAACCAITVSPRSRSEERRVGKG